MKIRTMLFVFALLLPLSATILFAQGPQNKSGFGFNGGANYLFGDAKESVPGFSAGITLALRFTDRMSLNVNTGYGTVGFKTNNTARSSVSNFIYGNLTLDYELAASRFRPFLLVGAGGVNFRAANSTGRFYDGEILAGAGMRLFLFKNIAFSISASGSYTTGDDLEGIAVGGKDIYATIRTGFTFYKSRRPSRRTHGDDYFTDRILWDKTDENLAEDEPVDFFNKNLLNTEKKQGEGILVESAQPLEKHNDANIDGLALEPSLTDTAKAKDKISNRSDEWLLSTFDNENTAQTRKNTQNDIQSDSPQQFYLQNQTEHNLPYRVTYENALDNFRNENYLAAIEKFQDLVARDPNHNLASNCEYWIGECYFGMGQYEKAAKTFERLLNTYLVSPKSDDALIMQGLAYMKLGKYTKAGMAFNRLLTMYPDSEYALKAQKYLKKLRA